MADDRSRRTEIGSAECAEEKRTGDKARDRLRTLISGSYSVVRAGADKYGRTLVVITLADGRDVGEVLMGETLARAWSNAGNSWCGR